MFFKNCPYYLAFRNCDLFSSRPNTLFYTNFYVTPPPSWNFSAIARWLPRWTSLSLAGIWYYVFLKGHAQGNSQKKVCTKVCAHCRVIAPEIHWNDIFCCILNFEIPKFIFLKWQTAWIDNKCFFKNCPYYLAFRNCDCFSSRPNTLFYTNFYVTPPP